MNNKEEIIYVDDDTEPVSTLLRLRLPPLMIGLVLGIGISLLISGFHEVISTDVRVAFFLPFVVYIAGAVGNQTQSIYTRDLITKQAIFHTYLIKESILGLILGSLFSLISTGIISLWFGYGPLALSVGISILISVSIAPLIGLLVSQAAKKMKDDPAAEAGPIEIVIQDMLTVIIYGLTCSLLIL